MPVRIHLHTLGDALITVGGREVRPSSPMIFAALLYFCLERGRRVPRTALQELLFPETDERSGAHSVRQLLYKLRHLGVPLHANDTALELEASCVLDDFPDDSAIAADHTLLARLSAGLLPAYEPRVSARFDRWLEEQRTIAAARARAAMLAAMARSQDAGDHVAMEAIASALLRLDPLNEAATLVRAGVLAITGQKYDAVRMLEHYAAEVGTTSPQLRIQPELLRRRIAERFHASDRTSVPMLGRQEELAFLLAQYARANEGHSTVSIVWGDAGIGKTRLLEEFGAHLVLKTAQMETARCQPFDRERPLGALVDLVPKLLRARGALGVSPDSLFQLRRLSGEVLTDEPKDIPPELTSTRIREAIGDLMLCIAAERPLVLVVEDAHWLDEASLRLLLGLVPGQEARLLLVITMRDRPRFPSGVRISESVVVRQLAPLNEAVSTDLLVRTLGAAFTLEDDVREQCVTMAAGNPLFICTVAEHLRLKGAAPSARAGIADLLKQRIRILDGPTLLLLRTIAALGNHATLERLRTCTGLAVDVELLSLQELADRGLIVRQNGSIRCAHDILTDVVLSDSPQAIRTAIYERLASILETEDAVGQQVTLLWMCAECWRLAQNAERAAQAFRRCATAAMALGQPLLALSSLEQVLALAAEDDRLPTLEQITLTADTASEAEAVLRTAKQYRAALVNRKEPVHPEVQLAEIVALRRLGFGADDSHDMVLARIALDKRVPLESRIRAARVFINCAELRFARAEALKFFSEIADIVDTPHTIHLLELLMVFHGSFGDMALAQEYGLAAWKRSRQCEMATRTRVILTASRVLFNSGAINEAMDATHAAVTLGEKLRLHDHLMISYCRLVDHLVLLDELAEARRWHSCAVDLNSKGVKTSAGYRLSNTIELAIHEGDFERAQSTLSELKGHQEASWPHAARTIRGFDLRLATHDLSAELNLSDLLQLDDTGRQYANHHGFALGLFGALTRVGLYEEAVRRWTAYLRSERRERVDLRPFVRHGVADNAVAAQLLGSDNAWS